jgi:hypothetical protein
MTTLAMKSEILHYLNRLPSAMQCQVLQFARALETTTHAGVSGSSLIAFAGCIPPDDLRIISQVVEEGCERVDAHEW